MKLYKDFKTEQEQARKEAEDKELLQKEVVIIYEQKDCLAKMRGIVSALLTMAAVGAGVYFLITNIY